jgi:hypothetical protein
VWLVGGEDLRPHRRVAVTLLATSPLRDERRGGAVIGWRRKPVSKLRLFGMRRMAVVVVTALVGLAVWAAPASAATRSPMNPGASTNDIQILESLANEEYSLEQLATECVSGNLAPVSGYCAADLKLAQSQLQYVTQTALPAAGLPGNRYTPILSYNASTGIGQMQSDLASKNTVQFLQDAASYMGFEYLSALQLVPECDTFYFLASTVSACNAILQSAPAAARTLYDYLCSTYQLCPSAYPQSAQAALHKSATRHPENPGDVYNDIAYLENLGNYAYGIELLSADCYTDALRGSRPAYLALRQLCSNDQGDAAREVANISKNLLNTFGVHWAPTLNEPFGAEDQTLKSDTPFQSLIDSANFLGFAYAGNPITTGFFFGDTFEGSINQATDCMALYFNYSVTALECYHVLYWGWAAARNLADFLNCYLYQYLVGTYFFEFQTNWLTPRH